MTAKGAQIAVKTERGKVTVQLLGLTPRGQKYIKAQKELACKSMASPTFKAEMSAAVKELNGSEA